MKHYPFHEENLRVSITCVETKYSCQNYSSHSIKCKLIFVVPIELFSYFSIIICSMLSNWRWIYIESSQLEAELQTHQKNSMEFILDTAFYERLISFPVENYSEHLKWNCFIDEKLSISDYFNLTKISFLCEKNYICRWILRHIDWKIIFDANHWCW